MTRKIVSERSITWAEARRLLLEAIKNSVAGSNLMQERTLEYLKAVTPLEADDAESLVEELLSQTSVSRDVAVVVANICPITPGEVRSILEMEKEKKYDEETVSKIVEIARKYCLQKVESEEAANSE